MPPAPPSDTQASGCPSTRKWPSGLRPLALPRSRTSASRASVAEAEGQGWLSLQVPSISRAAMPDSRTWGPSAHHMGPSPSHTRIGVHVNAWPTGTIDAASRMKTLIRRPLHLGHDKGRHDSPDQPALALAPRWRCCDESACCFVSLPTGTLRTRSLPRLIAAANMLCPLPAPVGCSCHGPPFVAWRKTPALANIVSFLIINGMPMAALVAG